MPRLQFRDFFSFKGRMARVKFLLATVCITVLSTLSLSAVSYLTKVIPLSPLSDLFFFCLMLVIAVLTIWAVLATEIKRLHDCNWSGYWVIAIFLWSACFTAMDRASDPLPIEAVLLLFFMKLLPVVLLCCIPGTKGSNRFGTDGL